MKKSKKPKRLKRSDILKKGAKLKVRRIDFNDPEVKKIMENAKRRQNESLRNREFDYKLLERRCTI